MTVLIGIIIFSLLHLDLEEEQPATQSPSPKKQIEDLIQPLEVPLIESSGKASQKLQAAPAPAIKTATPNDSRNPLVNSPDDSQCESKQIQAWIKQLYELQICFSRLQVPADAWSRGRSRLRRRPHFGSSACQPHQATIL